MWPKASFINPNRKFATIAKIAITKKLGRLSDADLNGYQEKLSSLLQRIRP